MTIKILTSELQAEFLKNCQSMWIESVNYEEAKEGGFYDTSITFKKHCDIELIAQVMFGAGISYGLDLKYSSYDNDVPR